MKVETARHAAFDWIRKYASKEAGFRGAYFSGSTVGMPDGAELPPASDVDIVVVIAQDEPPLKLGKFTYRETLLEVTYLSLNQFASVKEVLTSYHLAGSFRTNTIIADPTGRLRKLQKQVSASFPKLPWVSRRCDNAREKVENGLRNIDTSGPWYDQVTQWLFPTGVTTHVLLVAALRNPTVRLRYLAAREVLFEYGCPDLYEELLELLGCAQLTPERVEHHLESLARTFDVAADVAETPFFFSTDITTITRPVAIDGSRELIRSGNHREAVFWIVATFARCHKILDADASQDLQNEHIPAFNEMVADLGINSTEDLTCRAEKVFQFLPRLWKTTEAILQANTSIVNK
ncbi:MAG TPA: hypothetical protein VFT51_08395 [Bacillales bacterium]|nr:hypothetical protein [Bacillales bacterium]